MTRHRPAAAGLSAVLALALAPLAHAAAAPEGLWGVEGSRTVFRLAPCGGSICATLERSGKLIRDPDLRDVNNADASLRTRRLQGIEIMQDVRAAGPDAWRGRIYAPGMGRSFPRRHPPGRRRHAHRQELRRPPALPHRHAQAPAVTRRRRRRLSSAPSASAESPTRLRPSITNR